MKKKSNTGSKVYRVFSVIVITLLAIGFAFPLYWIITGSFKTSMAINAPTPQWWPQEWVSANYQKLFSRQTAPLWEIGIPFTGKSFAGPVVPAAIRWLLNTIFMAVVSMLLTCFTAAMAGYALAKKRFIGRSVVFTLIVCAMALPKQVILIPLLREMSSLHLYNTIWAVILPIVGWPFGVFLIKQFGEGIPGEMMEAAKIDGANEWKTFTAIAKKRTASCNHGSDFFSTRQKYQVDHIGAANPGSLLQKLDKGWKSGFFSGIIKAVDA